MAAKKPTKKPVKKAPSKSIKPTMRKLGVKPSKKPVSAPAGKVTTTTKLKVAPQTLAAPKRTQANVTKAAPSVQKTATSFPGMPKVGDMAPDFQLPDQHGHYLKLSQMRGNKVIVYFYPKDDTPGCSLEAQGFSNDIQKFQKRGVMVFGISKDDQTSHQKFIGKYGLKFQLLSDVTGETVKKYGCWVEKSMYGKKYMGIQRATFLIDEKGKVAKVWPAVVPEGHSQEILAAL